MQYLLEVASHFQLLEERAVSTVVRRGTAWWMLCVAALIIAVLIIWAMMSGDARSDGAQQFGDRVVARLER